MSINYEKEVERWGYLEISIKGKADKNPFTDYYIKGTFSSAGEKKTVSGFYDGDGIYKVRFMPSFTGTYEFSIEGSFSSDTYTGVFNAVEPTGINHGPVRVAYTHHFAYEDGTPHYSMGTTAYVWTHQKKEQQEKTLKSLEKSGFNKIRFCVFPKHYDYNFNEPVTYPYEGTPCDNSQITKENFLEYNGNTPGNDWDFARFVPKHFQEFEKNIIRLMELGIEADIIMLHPYDRWGFSQMGAEYDDLYFKYIIARFSAFRNVWWSLANEYDLMKAKSIDDWERLADIIVHNDPYSHLRAIHNCRPFYDHSRPWITHCSIQRQDVYRTAENVNEWRERYQKPVVLDEICYEGNIQHGWGNISGRELTRRYWEAACRGGYAGHGETYMGHDGVLWWSHGGDFHGESPERIKFLHGIIAEIPGHGLKPYTDANWDEVGAVLEETFELGKYYLFYYGFNRPSFRDYHFDDASTYDVDVIDTWDMTIKRAGSFTGKFTVELPGKEFMAVRIIKR